MHEPLLRRDSPRDAEVGGKHLLRDAQSAALSRDCTANVDGCVQDAPRRGDFRYYQYGVE